MHLRRHEAREQAHADRADAQRVPTDPTDTDPIYSACANQSAVRVRTSSAVVWTSPRTPNM